METILLDRQPTDAFYIAQRICGVCPISHGHASTMGSEEALGIKIPNNARIIRNIIEGAETLHSHILWFYTLTALDYVDVVKATTANIADTYALAAAAGTSTSDFGAVQKRLIDFVSRPQQKQLSIFQNSYSGHPAIPSNMPAELHLIAVAHYLEALQMQAEAAQIIAVMGGKFPHFMTSLPGGTVWIPTEDKLAEILFRWKNVRDWIHNAMIPDTLAIAPFYLGAASYGKGVGNYLSWGVFEDKSGDPTKRTLPRGMVTGATLTKGAPDPAKIKEYIDHSWYDSGNGLNPVQGETHAAYAAYDEKGKYSWAKAPRYDEMAMEVGPLSRMLVAYLGAGDQPGNPDVIKWIDSTLAALSKAAGATLGVGALQSLLGRLAARNLEAAFVADEMGKWIDELVAAVKSGDSSYFVAPAKDSGVGAGLWEAPRGALGHWVSVKNGKIDRYQVITPSTWDMSPQDAKGNPGPLEAALIGCPIADVAKPLEALRIVHSFDP
jgi:hydrogenase large subunit